jgi:hypothetical protein
MKCVVGGVLGIEFRALLHHLSHTPSSFAFKFVSQGLASGCDFPTLPPHLLELQTGLCHQVDPISMHQRATYDSARCAILAKL